MSKVVTSPVKRFPGTVTLSDPLTFPQYFAFSDALDATDEIKARLREKGNIEDITHRDLAELHYALIPGILTCVEEWNLEGNFPKNPTLETFPSTPRGERIRLIAWLVEEISKLFIEADNVPLAD